MQLYKSLYGLLHSTLSFYHKLQAELESQGFVVNAYDLCVAHNMVEMTETVNGNTQKVLERDDKGQDLLDKHGHPKL